MDIMMVTSGADLIVTNFVRLAMRYSDALVVGFDKLTYASNLPYLNDVIAEPGFVFIKDELCIL
jgi:dTDP-glucose 4,6-dehydratase